MLTLLFKNLLAFFSILGLIFLDYFLDSSLLAYYLIFFCMLTLLSMFSNDILLPKGTYFRDIVSLLVVMGLTMLLLMSIASVYENAGLLP